MIPERLWNPPTLNPLTKLAVAVALSTAAFSGGRATLYPCLAASGAIALWGGLAIRRPGRAAVAILTATVIVGLEAALVGALAVLARAGRTQGSLAGLLAGFLPTVARRAPAMLLGSWLSSTIRAGDFLAAADRARLPRNLAIALAVALRYLPTIGSETRLVRMGMTTRGLARGPGAFLRSPLRFMEERLVPLLFRSVAVADELAASAMTRGLESTAPRSHARPTRLGRADASALFTALGFSIALILRGA